jgi:hypothetical protein
MNRTARLDVVAPTRPPAADLPPLGRRKPNVVTFIEPTIEQGVPVPALFDFQRDITRMGAAPGAGRRSSPTAAWARRRCSSNGRGTFPATS